jgi:hypothetical protein
MLRIFVLTRGESDVFAQLVVVIPLCRSLLMLKIYVNPERMTLLLC